MGRKKHQSKTAASQPTKNTKARESRLAKVSVQCSSVVEPPKTLVIDIASRLRYPFTNPSENDALSEDDEEEEFEFHFKPRVVFACNLCLVCMKLCETPTLCEACEMVTYCSEKHKQENLPDHKDLCKILTEVCKTNEGLSLAKDLSPDQYRTFRVKLLEIIERGLGRYMNLWEKEIVLYPRLCRKCHGAKNLICCSACNMDFFCSEDHRGDHARWCQEYQILQRILLIQSTHGAVVPTIPNRRQAIPYILPETLDQLIAELFDKSVYYMKMDCHTYASLSHIATVPLTTLFAVQKSCENWEARKHLSIHIIGAEFQFECWNLHVWEKMFLHYLPALSNLSLTFTGPELEVPPTLMELLTKVKMCSQCQSSGRATKVTFNQGKLYHEVSDSAKGTRPDIICLFNAGLYRDTGFNGRDTWPMTIRKFCKTGAPIVVTSYTELEIPQDIERIRSVSDVEIVLEPQRNPFAALKPDRNFVSDDAVPLMYKNHFVAIVKGIS